MHRSQSNRSGFETYTPVFPISWLQSLNPTVVVLKLHGQFGYGFPVFRLNPTVVVLKPIDRIAQDGAHVCLNPTVVVLKPIMFLTEEEPNFGLNPTVVVLKHLTYQQGLPRMWVSIQP